MGEGEAGVATQKTRKNEKKNNPMFKICGSLRLFGSFPVFRCTFLVSFGLNFDKKFQPFKNHVNNEVLRGQELPNNTSKPCKSLIKLKALQKSYKSYYNH